ncbi:PH domain-containing protein [Niabella aquatica]
MMIVYKTKASLIIKLLFAIALTVVLIIALIEKSLALFTVAIALSAVIIYIFNHTYYVIYENTLSIKSGFIFNESLKINSIKKVTRKRKNLLSGPGFSVNRLVIEYNEHDCVIISPSLQKEFLDHLKRVNPDIDIIG